MKLNTLFIAGVCASALLASCSPNTAKENQLKYTHTSLVDGDAYHFFKLVGAKVVYEADYAAYAETVAGSSQAKQLAAKVTEVYKTLIPALDSLATAGQVDFPILGAEKFVAPAEQRAAVADSTVVEAHAYSAAYSDDSYIHHVQHETAVIKDQFDRLSRNTNKALREFAHAHIEKIEEIYTLAGGKADAHAHH
ncbi:hypothetical protein [Sphingobacterium suaedae]|uniref:DUF4142 domain-containing protein n=1 Tax=Sphingobacterium suaedae TaxID=1686402 RepID=A0ABW5KIA9_9SPHI